MPQRLAQRTAALVVWCEANPGRVARQIQLELCWMGWAREAWDARLRGLTLRRLWDQAAEAAQAADPPLPPSDSGGHAAARPSPDAGDDEDELGSE